MKVMHPLLPTLASMPLVAILRGLDPAEAVAVGETLVESGFKALEVPLNRPGALQCIEMLVRALPEDIVVGGGTMLTVNDVVAVHEAGGRLMVSPNCATEVIRHAAALGMFCAPGVATATEAFNALAAGAHALKLFPADMVGLNGLKALKSVLPAGTELWPVGGITVDGMSAWKAVGATGFGIGSQLYTPGERIAALREAAQRYVKEWNRVGSPASGTHG